MRRGFRPLRGRRRDDRPGGPGAAVVVSPGRGRLGGEAIPPEPTLAEQRQLLLDHFRLVVEQFGPEKGTILMRRLRLLLCPGASGGPGVPGHGGPGGHGRRVPRRWSSDASHGKSGGADSGTAGVKRLSRKGDSPIFVERKFGTVRLVTSQADLPVRHAPPYPSFCTIYHTP